MTQSTVTPRNFANVPKSIILVLSACIAGKNFQRLNNECSSDRPYSSS